ncbi:MAG: sulfatase-like hydrolase/transferase, partial [bacterium]|nr:sulfatase-like hydrolase/transferase [bacterium]
MTINLSRTALLSTLLSLPMAAADKPLNIVLIMADDVGYECFGAYGSKQYSTPVLDKLADSGVKFTHCYSTPLCTPTRVALMTGKSNVRNYADFGAMLPDQYTFVDLFRQAGYATAIAGKWQLQGGRKVKGVRPGEAGFDT